MDALHFLTRTLSGRGHAAARHANRISIAAVEHEIKLLPADIIRADGTLDLYDDVQKLFKPVFEKGHAAIQCGGWLGYIPLNERYALEVNARVPIGNLERLIGMAAGYSPAILKKYTRYFAHTTERPAALFDVVIDQMLGAFDRVWEAGLVKTYERHERVGVSPVGNIKPFDSAWHTRKAGRPTAVSSAFHRTTDFGPNRILRYAFEKLNQRYLELLNSPLQTTRVLRIKRSLDRLDGISPPSAAEISPRAIAQYVRLLPAHHEHYADALMLSQLVIANIGLAIRGSDGLAVLPTILIDMSKVFEQYARRLLSDKLASVVGADVQDGNKAGNGGAKKELFETIRPGLTNPSVTPDIVIMVEDVPRLVIDAKYKLPSDIPDRSDINQVIGYGARYACQNVMVLYAGRFANQDPVQMVGRVGAHVLYTGHLDLGANRVEDEETRFTDAIRALLAT